MTLALTLRDQRGLVRVRDHLRLRSAVHRATRRGELVRLFPGIYAVAAVARDPATLVRAALLWRPDAVIGGRAALAHLGWRIKVTDVVIHVRRPRTVAPPGIAFAPPLPPELTASAAGTLVAVAEACVLAAAHRNDLAPVFEGLRRRRLNLASLRGAARHAPRPERVAWRRLIGRLSRNPWSHPELDLHDLLRAAHVTGWQGNLEVTGPSGSRFVDVGFGRRRIAIEVQSYEHHTSREAFEADWRRHNELLLHGWRSLYVSPARIWADPEGFLSELLALLRTPPPRQRRRGTPRVVHDAS